MSDFIGALFWRQVQCNREGAKVAKKKREGIILVFFFASSFALFAPSRLHL